MRRRDFIIKSTATGLVLGSPLLFTGCANTRQKKVLILGGTNFVGPAIVEAALAQQCDITLFNRGITNPGLFPDLRWIKGDRDLGAVAYKPLLNEEWDVVIDVWPEHASLVQDATAALADKTSHYVFISSIAVYNNFQEVGLHEESAVVSLDLPKTDWYYPEEKLAAEKAVKTKFPENYTIVRPGAIKGWRDPALDLLYWCLKLKRDDCILAPGSGMDPIQFIDVNDVGRFTAMAIDSKLTGVYNCVGPDPNPLLWKDFLESAKKHFNSETEVVWADEDFLTANNVASFSDLPLWAPLSEDRGFMQISNKKLVSAGFQFTPMSSTLDDCLKWNKNRIENDIAFGTPQTTGLDRTRELMLLDKLKKLPVSLD